VSQFGKLGVTVIGNSREEVNALYGHTLHILDSETGIGIAPMAGSGDR
jgi:hypothetical protein